MSVSAISSTGPLCEMCKKPADKKCSKCQEVFYCSVECQTEGWKIHQSNCQPLQGRVSKIDPFEYFTKHVKQFNRGEILSFLNDLKKENPIYSVGSGLGAFEKFTEQEGFKVICIDPDSKSYAPCKGSCCSVDVLKKPDYDYLRNIPTIDDNATLFLIAPSTNGTWDIDAVKKHPWQQILLIVDLNGWSGGKQLLEWLKAVMKGTSKENYGIKYQIIKNIKNIGHPLCSTCILLEKDYKGETTQKIYDNVKEKRCRQEEENYLDSFSSLVNPRGY